MATARDMTVSILVDYLNYFLFELAVDSENGISRRARMPIVFLQNLGLICGTEKHVIEKNE